MDTDWCLYCEKHTKGGALYCSKECMQADGAAPDPLPPAPAPSAGFFIGDASLQAYLSSANSSRAGSPGPVVFTPNVLQTVNAPAVSTIRWPELPQPLTSAAAALAAGDEQPDYAGKSRTYAEVTKSNPPSRKGSQSSLLLNSDSNPPSPPKAQAQPQLPPPLVQQPPAQGQQQQRTTGFHAPQRLAWGALVAPQPPVAQNQNVATGGWITQGSKTKGATGKAPANQKGVKNNHVRYPFMASSLAPSGGRVMWDQESPEEPSRLEEEYESKKPPVIRPAGAKKRPTTTGHQRQKSNATSNRKNGKDIGGPSNSNNNGNARNGKDEPGAISGQFKKVPIAVAPQNTSKVSNSLVPQDIEAKKRNDELDRTKDFLRMYQKKRAMAMSSSVPSTLPTASLSSFSTPTVATTEIDPAVFKKTVNLDENRFIRDEKHLDFLLQQSWNN